MRYCPLYNISKNMHVRFYQFAWDIKGDMLVQKMYGKYTFFKIPYSKSEDGELT